MVLFTLQIDLHAEEMGNNIPAEIALLGDVKSVTEQVQYLSCVKNNYKLYFTYFTLLVTRIPWTNFLRVFGKWFCSATNSRLIKAFLANLHLLWCQKMHSEMCQFGCEKLNNKKEVPQLWNPSKPHLCRHVGVTG